MSEETDKKPGLRKSRVGNVVSTKMDKTIVVKIESRFPHPIYNKTIIKTKKYLVHDAFNNCKIGDQVTVKECRPLSKRKCWELEKILSKASLTF